MITIQNFSFSYKDKLVLQNIDIYIKEGDFCAIIGANGSGKTTLLKSVCRLLPSKKSIFLQHKEIEKYKPKELSRIVGYVAQNQDVVFHFSVLETVMMGRNPYQSRWETFSKKDENIVFDAMRSTNVLHLKDKLVNQLSGGEQQRVRIARAIAQQTPILLLDEPLANLDIVHQFEIMEILTDLNKKENITVIIVLHDISIALQYAKQVIMLKSGKIAHFGKSEEILTAENIKETFGLSSSFSVDTKGNIAKDPSFYFE